VLEIYFWLLNEIDIQFKINRHLKVK